MKNIQWIAFALVICSAALAGEFLPATRAGFSTANFSQALTVSPGFGDSLEVENTYKVVDGGYKKTGNASYYAGKFHGRRTSSGAVYHKDSLTAAHRSLKFGTLLRITNLSNDSVVVVKVTDRMGKSAHIVDLSAAGAKKLNFYGAGIAKVKIEEIKQ